MAPDRSTTATQVRVDLDEQVLSIAWADGHTSAFLLPALRQACPCASCGGKHVTRIAPPERVGARPNHEAGEDVRVETAGSVGLRITWADGHNAGIYRWDRLRSLQAPAA
jgi:DUF971 family protein